MSKKKNLINDFFAKEEIKKEKEVIEETPEVVEEPIVELEEVPEPVVEEKIIEVVKPIGQADSRMMRRMGK